MSPLVAGATRGAGRIDVLVNDVWDGEKLFEFDTPLWRHDLDAGANGRGAGPRVAGGPDRLPLSPAGAETGA